MKKPGELRAADSLLGLGEVTRGCMTADAGRVEGSDSGVSHNRQNWNPESQAVNSVERIHWREVMKGQGQERPLLSNRRLSRNQGRGMQIEERVKKKFRTENQRL